MGISSTSADAPNATRFYKWNLADKIQEPRYPEIVSGGSMGDISVIWQVSVVRDFETGGILI